MPAAGVPGAGVPAPGGRQAGGLPPGGAPGVPRASRITTAILVSTLVVVVLITGVLGTIAVLMTRNPDMPLGAKPPSRLAVPIHFAPVTEAKAGACTLPETYPDDLGQNCYSVAAGVTVNAVRKIEAIQEKNGTYSVRIAFAPTFREQITDLTEEVVKEDDPVRQQIAIVVGEKVVAAPRVAQAITADSLSIAGSFTKEQADAMVVRLLGSSGIGTEPTTDPQPNDTSVFTPPADPSTNPQPDQPVNPSNNGVPDTTATNPPGTGGTGTGGTGTGGTGTNGTGTDGAGTNPATRNTSPATSGDGDLDPRYATCKEANDNGYGPYHKGIHQEYDWYIDGNKNGIACELNDRS
ncbi:excalibur calcium-binding domain-containing protein [Streptosporangium sp. NPDC049644]|uniref:excalibur calcium-binding domain-containing protein n=1 Tax=Streptosporangium sp. NPDC049644 TaxID=3155507 RepID=UPI0034452310